MNKIFALIAFICLAKISFGQTYPITQNIGSTSTLLDIKGGGRVAGTFVLGHFLDTTTANALPYIKNYANGMITTDTNQVWLRSYDAQRWIQFFINNPNPTGDTLVWKLSGNTVGLRQATPVLGTLDGYDLNLMTDGSTRLVVPQLGITRNMAAVNKYLLYDTITKRLYYGDGGGSGGSYTASNGITLSGSDFKLGGSMTENTTIDGLDAYSLLWDDFDNYEIVSRTSQITSTDSIALNGSVGSSGSDVVIKDTVFIRPNLGNIYIDTLSSTDTTLNIVGITSGGRLVKRTAASLGGYWTGVGNDIYNNNSGNVGIGLSSPAFKLDVGGTSAITDRMIGINGVQMIYLPDQATFLRSMFVGTGGNFLSHTTGDEGLYNMGFGLNALDSVTTGYINIAFGPESMRRTTTGFWNTAFGSNTLQNNISGKENTAIGLNALKYNTGDFNTAVGTSALLFNTSGQTNTAVGDNSMRLNTTGLQNSSVGYRSMDNNTTGYFNTAMAYRALEDNTTGYGNSAFGLHAVSNNTTGYYNSGFGMYSLDVITTGRGNTGLGYFAGNNASQKVDAINSVALGSYSYTTADNQLRLSDSLTRITIPALPSNVGTKAVRYNPSTGDLSYADTTTGGGGSTSPAGNFGNIQLNRNGAFATPASDSLDYEASTGLTIKNGVNISGNATPLNMYNAAGATAVNKITWGTNYGATALELYNGGAGDRWGWGLPIGNMQFFIPNSAKFSVNSGGDLQASGTNEMFVVDKVNSRIRLNLATGIGTAGVTPVASALVEMSSTTQGFLPPRMTATQAEAISSPAEGLMIYSTNGTGTTITSKGWWGYDGSAWVKLN